MKKVVLIVETMEKGVGKHVTDLFSLFLKNRDMEIFVLYGKGRIEPKYIDFIEKYKDRFIKLDNLERKIGINDIKSVFEIKRILKNIKPDVVHCHSSKAGLAGRIAAKLIKVKKIYYSPHAYFFLKFKEKSLKRSFFLLIEKILARKCTDCTIATSKGERDAYIQNKIDKREKNILIEHGIQLPILKQEEINNYKEKIGIPKTQVIVGAMARLEPQKDPLTTLKVMENIVRKNSNVTCVLFGNGSMYNTVLDLHKKIESSYRGRIIIAGETKEPELSIEIMDIYLTTSLYEGLPYTLLMALGYGKPILATSVEGNKDCVLDGTNGFLFMTKDSERGAEKCQQILDQNKLMTKMGEESKKIFQNRFSISRMKKQYEELYLEEINE